MGCATETKYAARTHAVDGPPRTFLALEIVRRAQTAAEASPTFVGACQWHVNAGGALYGDHWGWCEDFKVLPRTSPGYLVMTTEFSGGHTGGYSQLAVMPALPASMTVFGWELQIAEIDGQLLIEFAGARVSLRPRRPVELAAEQALVEPPVDTGHFEPGIETPVMASVTYVAVSHGRLDSRQIAGRAI